MCRPLMRHGSWPDTLAPCAWNTCLARSRPMVLTSSTDASLRWSSNTTTLARRCRRGASTPSLENNDLRRRATAHGPRRPVRARWPDQPRCLRGLRREGSRPGAEPRRRRRHGQPVEPQGSKRASADRKGRRVSCSTCRPRVPTSILEQRLCQTEGAPPERRVERTIEGLWEGKIGWLL